MKVFWDPEGDKENMDPAGGTAVQAPPAASGRGQSPAELLSPKGGLRLGRGGGKRGGVPLADITPKEELPAPAGAKEAKGAKGNPLCAPPPAGASNQSVGRAPRLPLRGLGGGPAVAQEEAALARRLSGGGLRACR